MSLTGHFLKGGSLPRIMQIFRHKGAGFSTWCLAYMVVRRYKHHKDYMLAGAMSDDTTLEEKGQIIGTGFFEALSERYLAYALDHYIAVAA